MRALCEKYDLPYTTGPLHRQYGQALRTIIKLSVPNDWTSSDQPEPPDPVDRPRSQDRCRAADPAGRARRLVPRPRGGAGMSAATELFAWGESLDDLVGARVDAVRAEPDLRRPAGDPWGGRSPSSGPAGEVGRNAFHAPPLHLDCAARPARPSGPTGSW